MFILAQIAGALCATFVFRWLVPNLSANADQVVVLILLLSIPLDVTSRQGLSLNKTLRITPTVAGLGLLA